MKKYLNPILLITILFFATFSQSNAQIITTIAGNDTAGFSGDGTAATTAKLNIPYAVAIAGNGSLYIADYWNSRIRKINTSGTISTIAGVGTVGYSGDGGPATAAQFTHPSGIAVDKNNNIYIVDRQTHCIRKINAAGVISTIAGGVGSGFNGDGIATTKQLYSPWGVAVDTSGNVYVADEFNNRIRKIDASGLMTTIAGVGTNAFSGDGAAATAAELFHPVGVAVDNAGNVYIADAANSRIRKVNTSGIITTFAGTGSGTYSGEGIAATAAGLDNPMSVSLDSAGNVYIDDGNRIRKVNCATGFITTIAGNGTTGYSGDGGPATNAKISAFFGSATADKSGNVYIAEDGNNVIRKVTMTATSAVSTLPSKNNSITIYPNPVSDILSVKIQAIGKENSAAIIDMNGRIMASQNQVTNSIISFQTKSLPSGMYLVKVNIDGAIYSKQVIVEAK